MTNETTTQADIETFRKMWIKERTKSMQKAAKENDGVYKMNYEEQFEFNFYDD